MQSLDLKISLIEYHDLLPEDRGLNRQQDKIIAWLNNALYASFPRRWE